MLKTPLSIKCAMYDCVCVPCIHVHSHIYTIGWIHTGVCEIWCICVYIYTHAQQQHIFRCVWNVHDIVAHVFPYYIVSGTHIHIYTPIQLKRVNETRALWMNWVYRCVRVHFWCVCIAYTQRTRGRARATHTNTSTFIHHTHISSYGRQSVGFCRKACKSHRRYISTTLVCSLTLIWHVR